MRPLVPPRLTRVFSSEPLYFVTACTAGRQRLLATPATHEAFRHEAARASEFQIAVGRYVIMPDHLHLFVRVAGARGLGAWMGGLKRGISRSADLPAAGWQRGFFDHVLRSDESYAQKWTYVRMNPVRAGLVRSAEEWPYAGEIEQIDRAL